MNRLLLAAVCAASNIGFDEKGWTPNIRHAYRAKTLDEAVMALIGHYAEEDSHVEIFLEEANMWMMEITPKSDFAIHQHFGDLVALIGKNAPH